MNNGHSLGGLDHVHLMMIVMTMMKSIIRVTKTSAFNNQSHHDEGEKVHLWFVEEGVIGSSHFGLLDHWSALLGDHLIGWTLQLSASLSQLSSL